MGTDLDGTAPARHVARKVAGEVGRPRRLYAFPILPGTQDGHRLRPHWQEISIGTPPLDTGGKKDRSPATGKEGDLAGGAGEVGNHLVKAPANGNPMLQVVVRGVDSVKIRIPQVVTPAPQADEFAIPLEEGLMAGGAALIPIWS